MPPHDLPLRELYRMEAVRGRAHAEEGGDLVVLVEVGEHVGQRSVSDRVAVGGEEGLLADEVLLHSAQALADVAMHPGVHEGDAPFANVAREQLDVLLAAARAREHEVVGQSLVVVEEEVLDHVTLVTQADDEVVVPEVGVVLHDVEQDRPVGDRHHRLRDAGRRLLDPETEPTTEENDLHRLRPAPLRAASGGAHPAPPRRAGPSGAPGACRSRRNPW